MNVTRKNFAELLPKIVSQIKSAEFVSLDLEFTGLPNNKCYNMVIINNLTVVNSQTATIENVTKTGVSKQKFV